MTGPTHSLIYNRYSCNTPIPVTAIKCIHDAPASHSTRHVRIVCTTLNDRRHLPPTVTPRLSYDATTPTHDTLRDERHPAASTVQRIPNDTTTRPAASAVFTCYVAFSILPSIPTYSNRCSDKTRNIIGHQVSTGGVSSAITDL
jgi:hypothetical protein